MIPDSINTIDKSIEVLKATNDGNDLSPQHLYLIEVAVNNNLSEQGEIAFEELYQSVLKGYKKPYFHGIEHLTIDHEGYVYWKSIPIEHYSNHYAFTERAKRSAQELAERCKYLETLGVPVTTRNAIWKWEQFLVPCYL